MELWNPRDRIRTERLSVSTDKQQTFSMVTARFSLGVKRQVREADHSPPTNAEVKKMWIYTSTPSYAFIA
jgi:hypothetical protein